MIIGREDWPLWWARPQVTPAPRLAGPELLEPTTVTEPTLL